MVRLLFLGVCFGGCFLVWDCVLLERREVIPFGKYLALLWKGPHGSVEHSTAVIIQI